MEENVFEELVEMGLVEKVVIDGEIHYRLTSHGNNVADDIAFEEGYILAN